MPTFEDDFELIDASEAEVLPHVQKSKEATASDPAFHALVLALQQNAEKRPKGPLFHSQPLQAPSSSLHDLFLSSLPVVLRQEHTCNACREFVNSHGDLCLVEDDGTLRSLVWAQDPESVPPAYRNALGAINRLFVGATVTIEYRITTEAQRSLGTERTSNPLWTHFNVTLKDCPISEVDPIDTKTSYDMLSRVLNDNSPRTIAQAHHLLHQKLPYSTSHKPSINWLQDVATKVGALEGEDIVVRKRNLTTRYARTAWVGCLSSLRGGMIGALLADVASGLEYPDIEAKWNALANPLHYLRPTAEPSPGNIESAEKTFQALGYTKDDLKRYFMTADQVPERGVLWRDVKLWNKAPVPAASAQIFSSLRDNMYAKAAAIASPDTPDDDGAAPTTISFRNFVRRVLPNVKSMELELKAAQCLTFFSTGAPNSKSPFSFGSATNTASWYYWAQAGSVTLGSLTAGWNEVTAITSFPHMWEYLSPTEALEHEQQEVHVDNGGEKQKWPHSRSGVRFLFCLKGAKEKASRELCLFPTLMKGALHGVRKTVEAFSAAERIQEPIGNEGKEQVGGLANTQDQWLPLNLRVKTNNGIRTKYKVTLYD